MHIYKNPFKESKAGVQGAWKGGAVIDGKFEIVGAPKEVPGPTKAFNLFIKRMYAEKNR